MFMIITAIATEMTAMVTDATLQKSAYNYEMPHAVIAFGAGGNTQV